MQECATIILVRPVLKSLPAQQSNSDFIFRFGGRQLQLLDYRWYVLLLSSFNFRSKQHRSIGLNFSLWMEAHMKNICMKKKNRAYFKNWNCEVLSLDLKMQYFQICYISFHLYGNIQFCILECFVGISTY